VRAIKYTEHGGGHTHEADYDALFAAIFRKDLTDIVQESIHTPFIELYNVQLVGRGYMCVYYIALY
jgi:hypothetical protein